MAKHVEMINEYLVEDDSYDFKFFDNHGLLIRCKDCKHYKDEKLFGKQFQLCIYGGYEPRFVEPDHYCGYGERREEI